MNRVQPCRLLAPTAVFLAFLAPAAAQAAYGDLDPTFGSGGTAIGGAGIFNGDVVVTSTGRIVTVGTDTGNQASTVTVHTADGKPDTGFSGDGAAPVAGASDSVDDIGVGVQPDGKVLTAFAQTDPGDSKVKVRIDRFLPSGDRDPDFGSSGIVRDLVVPASAGSVASVVDISVLPDGRFLVAGATETAANVTRPFVRRYSVAGVPDPGYGNGGVAGGDLESDTYPAAMATLPDGSAALLASEQSGECLVARLTPAGALDPGFGGGDGTFSRTFTSTNGPLARCVDVALAPGGAVAMGVTTVDGDLIATDEAQVARLTPAGALDPAFGGDGVVTVGPKGSSLGGLTFQPDGKIAVTTGLQNEDLTDSVARITRLNQDGTPDAGFAAAGSRIVNPGPKTTYLGPIVWDPAGRLVAGGALFDNEQITQTEELARVLADSPPAATITGPATAVLGTPTTFSASDSTDPGGAVTGYAWDLDADGAYDDATTASVSRTFAAAGSPTIAVRVQDANGLTATASRSVTVTAATTTLPQTIPPVVKPKGPGKATVKAKKLRFKKNGVLKVPVRCPAGGERCKGKIQIKQGKKKLSSSGSFSLPAGGRTTVALVLKTKVRKTIRRRGAKGKKVTLVFGKKTKKVILVRD